MYLYCVIIYIYRLMVNSSWQQQPFFIQYNSYLIHLSLNKLAFKIQGIKRIHPSYQHPAQQLFSHRLSPLSCLPYILHSMLCLVIPLQPISHFIGYLNLNIIFVICLLRFRYVHGVFSLINKCHT